MLNACAAPSRTDWRWAVITTLYSWNDARAKSELRANHDDLCARAYQFYRDQKKNYDTIRNFPDIAAAYEMYMGDMVSRGLLEGFLLTGVDDARIAESFACHPKVIQVYHDLFFDVRPRLKAHAWISAKVFGDMPYTGVHRHDRKGMLQRIAWLGGIEAFEASISPRANMRDVCSVYKDVIERALAQQTVEIAIGGANSPEAAVQFLATTMGKFEAEGDKKRGGENDYEEAVSAFVKGIGITVADPTVDSNLKLPARELRESEYEVIQ